MDVKITPAALSGAIPAIPSKSDAHRLLICAALADGPTELWLPSSSRDIDATCRCLSALGTKISRYGENLSVTPIESAPPLPRLDCEESGSTLRFMLPVAAALTSRSEFSGCGRLPERPIAELASVMEAHGVSFSAPKLPFSLSGRLAPGKYSLPGNVSSQYITGLLLGLSALEKESEICLTTGLESKAYIDITLHALRRFGIVISETGSGWFIPGGKKFVSPGRLAVDGDWSNAAFFLTAGAISSPITVTGLDAASPQGDKEIVEVLRRFGAQITQQRGSFSASPAKLSACTVDVRDIPDSLPILAVLASCSEGETVFTGAARLRFKESDRLLTTAAMINALGGDARETPDGLVVRGKPLSGGIVSGAGDHRIVMAAAAAAGVCSAPVVIRGAEAVGKSYPNFFEDYRKLGGRADVI